MKAIRSFILILLAMVLVTGATQRPAGAELVNRVSQIYQLFFDTDSSLKRIMPDGTIQPFTLSAGQTFVMTAIYLRFYASATNTGPYRFFLRAPDATNALWIENMDNIQYPTGGATVYGGGTAKTLNPGVRMSVIPTYEVRQILVPPNDPNNGPIITGTLYGRITGYVIP